MSSRNERSWRHSTWVRYSVPPVTVVGAALITGALQALSPRVPGALVFCAAIFSAWFGGIGPGLLAAAISSAAILFNLVPAPYPVQSIGEEFPRLAMYSTAVFFVAWMSGLQRRVEEQLQGARAHLESQVASRTAELSRTNAELQSEIAERKIAEQALAVLHAELAHVSRVTLMGELTASIAHEVNQPLAAIMNYAGACRRILAVSPPDVGQVDQALVRIADDAHRASDVIARIRALIRKQATERTPARVHELVEEVVAIADFQVKARQIALRLELAKDLPALNVDRVQIQQVLLNLIINSIEAMDARRPADRLLWLTVAAAAASGTDGVSIVVRDQGLGIEPHDVARLFAPFFTTKSEGLGLGLAISRSLAEAHGGRLVLVATGKMGSAFELFLPALPLSQR